MTEIRLRATALTKSFRHNSAAPVTVIDSLDLTLAEGQLVVVTGPSLSGKTTLVDLLAGWTRPDSGAIEWDAHDTHPPPWSYLSVVPQGFALLQELTVAENIDMAARFDPKPNAPPDRVDRCNELLERLGLDRLRDRGAYEISVGERQRTMVARALVDRPAVILADEPVAHQDQRHAQVVVDLLREATDHGTATLITTRTPNLADLADRAITLDPRS